MENMNGREMVGCCALFLACVMLLTWLALGGAGAEEWTVKVSGFDFQHALVELTDEDGYVWTCPFGENDWSIGEEYVLVLEDGQEPEIKEV